MAVESMPNAILSTKPNIAVLRAQTQYKGVIHHHHQAAGGGGAMDAHRKGPTVRTPNTTHVMLNMIATAFPSTRAIYRSMQEHRGEWT